MLVVLSDLHLTDRTSGVQTVSADLYRSIFERVRERADDVRAEEVTLLFLGDIFDMLRTTSWFEDDTQPRPWMLAGDEAAIPEAAVQTASRILRQIAGEEVQSLQGEIPAGLERDDPRRGELIKSLMSREGERIAQNSEIFKLLQNPPLGDRPVHKVFIPGNHDRLLNTHPTLQEQVRRLLNLHGTGAFANCWESPTYGVFARHGHEWDALSFARAREVLKRGIAGIPDESYILPPLSEVLAVELSTRMPYTVRNKLLTLHQRSAEEAFNVEQHLSELDDVRPTGALLAWISQEARRRNTTEATQAVMRDCVSTIIGQPLLWQAARSNRVPWHTYVMLLAMRFLPLGRLVRLSGVASRWATRTVQKDMQKAARREIRLLCADDTSKNAGRCKALGPGRPWLRYFLVGHTHLPAQWPAFHEAAPQGNRRITYVNTGTWRPYHHQAIEGPGFTAVDTVTCTLVFSSEHDPLSDVRPGNPRLEQFSVQASGGERRPSVLPPSLASQGAHPQLQPSPVREGR